MTKKPSVPAPKEKKIKVITKLTDKELKKNLETIINYEYNDNKKMIDAITEARIFIESMYGVKTPDKIWENILFAYLEKILI